MHDETSDIKVELASFTATVKEWMATTNEYRKNLCGKIDKITDKVNDLPCKTRSAWYSSMNRQVMFMWVGIGLLFGVVIEDGIDRNTALKNLKTIQAELINERK